MRFHITLEEAVKQLNNEQEQRFTVLMKHGSLKVEYFAPDKIDRQTPHDQDELYVIASGNAYFFRDGETVFCQQGDVLFVPAGKEHRFENFTDDFATWVIFYGKSGGEVPSL